MVAAGRSTNAWTRKIAIVLALAGCVWGNQPASDPPRPSVSPQPSSQTDPDTVCLARSSWDIEAELFQLSVCRETRWGSSDLPQAVIQPKSDAGSGSSTIDPVAGTSEVAVPTAESTADPDHDEDTLLDSASFLSFEDWKKQNLAKAGQSAENVGGGRRAVAADKDGRRQPGINNALDALGDDTEIELDFGGFGAETPEASPTAWGTPIPSHYAANLDDEGAKDVHQEGTLPADASRRKDAGTTCKERFNYASFDCAATVLKTNPECKGSSSVLVENKDSYMLNECRANNKFLILELCDDILVDTVVLANYEFFSSIFHTFRVSVSDRYPAKPDQWKELGVYEARNTREVQAFAVENSLIWARYLRIEFLTHYGHEFYCPVSLIRVHGTTMMEEYKHDESVGRGEHEVVQPIETNDTPDLATEPVLPPAEESVKEDTAITIAETCLNPLSEVEMVLLGLPPVYVKTCALHERPATELTPEGLGNATHPSQPLASNSTISSRDSGSVTPGLSTADKAVENSREAGDFSKNVSTIPDASVVAPEPAKPPKPASQNITVESIGKATAPKDEQQSASPESTRPTSTQPPSSNPTTQESFFKSVHKRLQMLESNSTLSLLYIEEQSRILRDAFNKVEKRQLSKTSNFLENLNITVVNELKEFRDQYDYVWRSVAFEFEHQRMRYHQEVHAMSAQLGVLADELVFQKRVTVIQSIMVMCCFALVLFSRGSVSNYMEFPRVQRMVARSYMRSPISTSPSASPSSTRPSSYREKAEHRRNLSDSSSSSQESMASPTVNYVPPTPTSETSHELDDKIHSPQTPDSMSVPTGQFRSRSVPPVLNGHLSELDMDGDDASKTSDEPPRTSPSQ